MLRRIVQSAHYLFDDKERCTLLVAQSRSSEYKNNFLQTSGKVTDRREIADKSKRYGLPINENIAIHNVALKEYLKCNGRTCSDFIG